MNKSMKDKGITPEEMRYKKKKQNKGTPRSDHKHIYAPCFLFRFNDFTFDSKKRLVYSGIHEHCTICGRVGNMIESSYFPIGRFQYIKDAYEEQKKKFPEAPSYLVDGWFVSKIPDLNNKFDFENYKEEE